MPDVKPTLIGGQAVFSAIGVALTAHQPAYSHAQGMVRLDTFKKREIIFDDL
jgi:hypothetical protein